MRTWMKPVVGAGAFAAIAVHLGGHRIGDAIVAAGPWFVVVAVVDAAAMLCDAAAIRELARRKSSLANAVVAQASGYVLNRLTPGSMLGEPLKVSRLAREAPHDVAVSAIVLYNVATFGVGVVVIAIGAPLALLALPVPPSLEVAVWIASVALVVALGVLIALVRRGLVGTLIGAMRRVRAISRERANAWRERTRTIDASLASFGDAPSRRGLVLVFASRALEQIGTLLLLHGLGAPLSDGLGLAVLSFGIPIAWASSLTPLGLGVADGGHYTLFALFGATATLGVAFAMLDRARASILTLLAAAVCGLSLSPRASASRRSRSIRRAIACAVRLQS